MMEFDKSENTPNAETLAALKDVAEKRNLTRHTSLEEFWADLDEDASSPPLRVSKGA